MNYSPLILLVDDECVISNFISAVLTTNDYKVKKASTGKEAISLVTSICPDIILLDLSLPDIDGLEVLKKIRSWSEVPIIIVSARSHEREKVEALDLGADDYITKPFGIAELLARIRTALRHSQKSKMPTSDEADIFSINGLIIDYGMRKITVDNREIHLTPIEYKIIVLLSKSAGKVLTHDFISKEIWGPYTDQHQTIRVNMANIRRKIEPNPSEPKYILTEMGVGYRMIEESL